MSGEAAIAKAKKWCERNPPAPREKAEDYLQRVTLMVQYGLDCAAARRSKGKQILPPNYVSQARTACRKYYNEHHGIRPEKPYKIEADKDMGQTGRHYFVSFYAPGFGEFEKSRWMSKDEVQLWPQLLTDYNAVKLPPSPPLCSRIRHVCGNLWTYLTFLCCLSLALFTSDSGSVLKVARNGS